MHSPEMFGSWIDVRLSSTDFKQRFLPAAGEDDESGKRTE
jgi:hypothetical protein